MGRCPQCGEWNTLVEEIIKETKHSRTPSRGVGNQTTKPTALPDIEISSLARVSTTFGEIDRVLGGGIVPGALNALRVVILVLANLHYFFKYPKGSRYCRDSSLCIRGRVSVTT